MTVPNSRIPGKASLSFGMQGPVFEGEVLGMAIIGILGGLIGGALLLAGIRTLVTAKKPNRDVVSLH
jgi:hypothetical protein